MRANVELTPGEKSALSQLTGEEREAVIDQMLERVREDLEWLVSLDLAKQAAAAAPVRAPAAPERYRWPSGLERKRAR